MTKKTIKGHVETIGHLGLYTDEHNVLSFSMGDYDTMFESFDKLGITQPLLPYADMQYSTLTGSNGQTYNVLWRGCNNHKCEEIEVDVKNHSLLPRLYKKQSTMLYGQSLLPYKRSIQDGKFIRLWEVLPQVQDWLDSWEMNGLPVGYKECARAMIRNFYTFNDFFVKYRFSRGKLAGIGMPLTGIECIENKLCRLATMRNDVAFNTVDYSDFSMIAVGRWDMMNRNFQFYPRFKMSEIDNYRYVAIGHYRDKSIGEYYGLNETHSGTQAYIKGSNLIPRYINSFLKNSLAAKKHIKIPSTWIGAKESQIQKLCKENKMREDKGEPLLLFNDTIDVGTVYKESSLHKVINAEMNKLSNFLSGEGNQGKSYTSYTYTDPRSGVVQSWEIEDVDMKYKEYMEALIAYGKRADEVLTSSLGIDSSVSNISKDGIISKSGADVYYNYLIYLMQLNPEDEICSEPFNVALKLNFPNLYKQGYRLGFYRETPSRQEEVAPADRLNNIQS